MTKEEVCLLCFCLLSRQCHKISSVSQLDSWPSQNLKVIRYSVIIQVSEHADTGLPEHIFLCTLAG